MCVLAASAWAPASAAQTCGELWIPAHWVRCAETGIRMTLPRASPSLERGRRVVGASAKHGVLSQMRLGLTSYADYQVPWMVVAPSSPLRL